MAIETFPYSSQLRSKGREEGRGESCTDLETLGAWLDRSLVVETVGDLFAEEA